MSVLGRANSGGRTFHVSVVDDLGETGAKGIVGLVGAH